MRTSSDILSKIAIGVSIVALAVSIYGISSHKVPCHKGFGPRPEMMRDNRDGGFRGEHGQRHDMRDDQGMDRHDQRPDMKPGMGHPEHRSNNAPGEEAPRKPQN
jgi:hypothetical protein